MSIALNPQHPTNKAILIGSFNLGCQRKNANSAVTIVQLIIVTICTLMFAREIERYTITPTKYKKALIDNLLLILSPLQLRIINKNNY